MHNFRLQNSKFKHLIDNNHNITIDLWSSENFAIKRKCNSFVDLSKFASNKKILNTAVALSYNQPYCQINFIHNSFQHMIQHYR